MFRIWGKIFKENRLVRDIVVCNDDVSLSRTQKVYKAIDNMCFEFDLSKPLWLRSNINEFIKRDKTRFTSDNFIEIIDFDFLEIHVLEEDSY